jgi:hypothetical protein
MRTPSDATSLADAIEALYVTFASAPRPVALDYCQCCFTPEEERALLADVPLRALPAETLEPYAIDVLLTVGGVADFRYFLPRMLELSTGAGFILPDLESMLGRLRLAGWNAWPADEQTAVRDFLTALWAHTLTAGPDEEVAAAVLCAIGNAEDDVRPYLAVWGSALAWPAAAAHLRKLLEHGCRMKAGQSQLANAFWRERGDQAGQVLAWLSGAELSRIVSATFDATDDERTLRDLAVVDGLL